MSRLKRVRRIPIPPVNELRREARILREIAADDPRAVALADAVETIIDAGGFVRHGGGERTKPRVTPAQALWKKPPPDTPGG
jgi:hypothetical protein